MDLGLYFAAIALLPEGEIEVVAVEADPVSFSGLHRGFAGLGTAEVLLDWSIIVHGSNSNITASNLIKLNIFIINSS